MLIASIPIFAIRVDNPIGKAIRLLSAFIAMGGVAILAQASESDAKTPSPLGIMIAIPYFFCWVGQIFARRGWPLLEGILSFFAYKIAYSSTEDVFISLACALATTLLASIYTLRKAPIKAFVDD